MSNTTDQLVTLTVRVPDTLRQKAKIVCATEGTTVQELVQQLLNNYVNAKERWSKQ